MTAVAKTKLAPREKARDQKRRGHVIPDLPLWSQATRIGGGLTPARIAAIVRAADTGEMRQLMDLANECRQRDAHLHAVLATNEECIAGLSWQVAPPTRPHSKKPRAKDQKVADWVEDRLRANPNLQRLIADLAGAIFYSFAVSEILWRKEAGKLVPDHFVSVAPRRFRFRRTDGALVFQDDGGPEVDLFSQFPNKFILSMPRVTGDVPTREGLCRVLVWMSAMRNWAIGDWLKTGEMSWKPWRIATYKKENAQLEDVEDLETIMRRMSTDYVAVIPDSTEIKVEWPQGAVTRSSTHAELSTVLGNEMSKAVLGQTETTQSSASSGYAQAKVHDAVRRDLREARAKQIAADITRCLITPMTRLNFGDTVEVPKFEFVTQDPVDVKSFSESIKTLREAGAGSQIPIRWVLDQAGIPEPDGDEPTLGDPATAAGAGQADGEAEKPAGEEPDEEEEPEAEEPQDD